MNYELKKYSAFFAVFLLIFTNFCSKPMHFCNFFAHFYEFLLIFYHFFLAHFTQALQTNLPNPIFTSKTNIPTKKNSKKTPIFSNPADFQFPILNVAF